MFKLTSLFITMIFVLAGNGYGQQLSNQVLLPAAGLASSGIVDYSQTIGETAIEIIGNEGFTFTQGFQQPSMKIIDTNLPQGTGVEVYPNPATDYLQMKFFGTKARTFRVEIINLTGTILKSFEMLFITTYYHIEPVEITSLKNGFYFVRIISNDKLINRIFKIEKM